MTTEQIERMGAGTPTIGRIVLYTLSAQDAELIDQHRKDATNVQPGLKIGNNVAEGQQYPAVVVRNFGGPNVNLKVLLDGDDDYWVTSCPEGSDKPGTWAWPPRV